MSSEDVEVVRNAWAAWQRDGPQALLESCDPEIEWTVTEDEPESGTFRGIEAVTELVRSWQQAFEEFRAEPYEFEDAGDAVLVSLCFSARAHGGEAVMEVEETHVVKLRGGKIAEIREYRTMEQARKALKASLESF
jgi:ketosteroid isomerase-like protein